VALAFHLYLVTDRHQTRGRPLLTVIEQALAGGVDAVQLREKDLPARVLLGLARDLRRLCDCYGARLLINDRIDVALAAGADGVHLPANSFAVTDARALLGPDRLVGVSTHSAGEVESAAAAGADFAVFGPVFDTPSKRRFGPALGVDAVRRATAGRSIPVLAIGGITTERVALVRGAGADGVAAIRTLLSAADPQAEAEALRAALSS
jgi:thiamine-phosphate pyrophosphorylase